jgi:hypothetical protein
MVQAAGFRSARTADGGTRVTAEKLLTLPGFTFQTFINSYIVSEITSTVAAPRASSTRVSRRCYCGSATG